MCSVKALKQKNTPTWLASEEALQSEEMAFMNDLHCSNSSENYLRICWVSLHCHTAHASVVQNVLVIKWPHNKSCRECRIGNFSRPPRKSKEVKMWWIGKIHECQATEGELYIRLTIKAGCQAEGILWGSFKLFSSPRLNHFPHK